MAASAARGLMRWCYWEAFGISFPLVVLGPLQGFQFKLGTNNTSGLGEAGMRMVSPSVWFAGQRALIAYG